MIKITSKLPMLTSQFRVCPIPYRLDTYTGCVFGCKYCFARDIIQHMRDVHGKQGEEREFNHLLKIDIKQFKRWVDSTIDKNSDNIHRVAFRERIPLKIGGVSDPFPPIERQEKVTYEVLKILHEIDYPVQISTKNPSILADYAKEFESPNWAINVTIITPEERFRKIIEPCAPTIDSRLEAIQDLTKLGMPVLVRVQPVIFPYILDVMDELLNKISHYGAYAIMMEGLKVKVSMCQQEQLLYKEISEVLGYDIRQWYKENGVKTKSDYELRTKDKMIYINKAKELCSKYHLKFFSGDNDCRCEGCSGECCGTEVLRKYKTIYQSNKLLDCKITFGRNKNNQTIRESIENNPGK